MAKALQGSGLDGAALGPLFERVHKLKALIRLADFWQCGQDTVVPALREPPVCKAKANRKEECLTRINFTVTEYFLAILAVQSPLRHSVTFWRGWVSRANNAKLKIWKMFKKGHGKADLF